METTIADILPVLYTTTLPGAAGGLTLFIYGLRNGHYQNNKYRRKMMIEVFGAMLVASFLAGWLLPKNMAGIAGAFILGLLWANVIQIVRNKVTKIVKAAIGEISK